VATSTCFDNSGGVTNDGNPIVIYPCIGGSNEQRWLIVPNIDQTFSIMVQRKCMDLAGGATSNGTRTNADSYDLYEIPISTQCIIVSQ
jgi:hypothetical protein